MAIFAVQVRHRLKGVQAEVLDYADLIVSSSVESAVLKPVVLAGENHFTVHGPSLPQTDTCNRQGCRLLLPIKLDLCLLFCPLPPCPPPLPFRLHGTANHAYLPVTVTSAQ